MSKVLLFGYLRRDVMLLGVYDLSDSSDPTDVSTVAQTAVEQGRAQTAWTITVDSFATASDVKWANPDGHTVTGHHETASSVPALNPLNGEQETTDLTRDMSDAVTVKENIANVDQADPVDTGRNSDQTPTEPKPASDDKTPTKTDTKK